VIALGEAEDPYLKRRKRVSVFMKRVQRALQPQSGGGKNHGTLVPPGKFVNAGARQSSLDQRANALWITHRSGTGVVVVQVAGLIATAYTVLCAAGERIARVERTASSVSVRASMFIFR